jgi:hypothetical protein
MASTSIPRSEAGTVDGLDVPDVVVTGAVVLGLVLVLDVRLVEVGTAGADVRGEGWVRVGVDTDVVDVGDATGRAGVPPHAASAIDAAAAAPSTAATALTPTGWIDPPAGGQRRMARTPV